MPNRTYIRLCAGIIVLVLTSQAPAQDEQWLQYHSQRQAQQIVGDMSTSAQEVTSVKPLKVELPKFKDEKQFFAKWSTPMVKSGRL